MTTYAASVTIVDLPVGGAVTGSELFEAVQTTNGVVRSVQLSLSQMLGIGGLPTGGATGTLLNKSSGSNYSTQFSAINTFVNIGTALATTGSATSIVVFVATSGIGSTQLGALAVQSSNLTTGAVGSTQLGAFAVVAGSIATSAVGSTQLGALAVQQANITAAAIGSTQIANFAITSGQIATATIGTAQIVTGALGMTLLATLTPSAVASTNNTTVFTSTYSNYLITFQNVVPAANTATLQMTVATTGSAFVAGSYVSIAQVNVSSVLVTDTSTSALLLSGTRATTAMATSTVYGLNGFVRLFNPANTVFRKSIVGEVSYAGAGAAVSTATLAQASINGIFDGNSNAIVGVNFAFASGNIATGIISIYGSP